MYVPPGTYRSQFVAGLCFRTHFSLHEVLPKFFGAWSDKWGHLGNWWGVVLRIWHLNNISLLVSYMYVHFQMIWVSGSGVILIFVLTFGCLPYVWEIRPQRWALRSWYLFRSLDHTVNFALLSNDSGSWVFLEFGSCLDIWLGFYLYFIQRFGLSLLVMFVGCQRL